MTRTVSPTWTSWYLLTLVSIFTHVALAAPSAAPTGPSVVPTGPQYTIIDDYSDQWTLNGGWGTYGRSEDNYCAPDACLVQPDRTQAHAGTWSETSANGASATLSFDGTGVSLYLVCPGKIPLADGGVAIFSGEFTFAVDGVDAGSWSIVDNSGCENYVYSAQVFERVGLAKGSHTVTITNGGSGASDLLLDFAVVDTGAVTTTTPPPATSTTTTTSSEPSTTVAPPASPPSGNPIPSGPIPAGTRIDDQDAAWTYDSAFGSFTAGSICEACLVKPDPAKLEGKSWHEAGGVGTATFRFSGKSIAVFGACPGPIPLDGGEFAIFSSNFTFTLDGKAAGSLSIPGGCDKFVYAHRLFQRTGLAAGDHVFTITNGGGTSDLIVDFAVVDAATTPPSDPEDPSDPPSDPTTPPPPSNPPASPKPPSGTGYVRVDDTAAQVTYKGPWGEISKANPCTQCDTQFDFAQLNGGTYHELTGEGSASIAFHGTEVYVFGACPGTLPKGGQFAQSFTFNLDGKSVGSFNGPAGGCSSTVYSQQFYRVTGLASADHTLTISNVQAGTLTSDLVIDFFVVKSTGDQPAVPTPPQDPPASGGTPPSLPPASPAPPTGTNFIVLDDTSAAIAYSPLSNWGAISRAAPCAACATSFDFNQLQGGTYHEIATAGSATVTFAGTGIWLYGVCAGTLAAGGQFGQRFSFAVDGKASGSFNGPAGGCSRNVYKQMLLKVTGLSKGNHILTVNNLQSSATGALPSDLVIDFFVVDTGGLSQPAPPPPESPETPGGDGEAPPPPSAWTPSPAPQTGADFVTLDDVSPQIVYSEGWGTISKAAPCEACATKFDFEQLHEGTYHELSTPGGTATISFAGTALYIYGVCPGTLAEGGQFLQAFSLNVDGGAVSVPDFHGPAGGCTQNAYNQLLFSVEGLTAGEHSAVISNTDSGYASNPSDLILDFVVINTAGVAQPGANGSTTDPPSQRPLSGTFVDDTDAGWSFAGPFGAISAASPCTECLIQPNASKAYQNSWRDLSSAGSATLTFKSSSVQAFVICPGPIASTGSFFRGVFDIAVDGTKYPRWEAPETGCSDTLYDVMIANVTGLDGSLEHTLVITNVVEEGGTPSDLMLDYAVLSVPSTGVETTPGTDGSVSPTSPVSQPEDSATFPHAAPHILSLVILFSTLLVLL